MHISGISRKDFFGRENKKIIRSTHIFNQIIKEIHEKEACVFTRDVSMNSPLFKLGFDNF